MSLYQARAAARGPLRWRALARTTGALGSARALHALSWHLVECADPAELDSHCPVGVHLLSTRGDADGHCLVEAACPRCALGNADTRLQPLTSELPSVLPLPPVDC